VPLAERHRQRPRPRSARGAYLRPRSLTVIDLTVVESIFFAALDKASEPDRAAFLDQACGKDAELRQHVERLLAAHPRAASFLAAPAAEVVAAVEKAPIRERPGTVLGPYKLMEQIGEGGMGLVFVAEQQPPLRRKVALKLIKPGMGSRDVLARFEAERQALALMDHPNIARVLDAGTTDSGQPYFVMELVKGIPIVEYCDRQQLTARARLELFVAVCQAVQHAHGKGIIHRDLKPSNILVALHDGVPVVKVIDFGVAKAIGQQLTEKTIYTGFNQLIGTPMYMSPEQAGMSGLDIDTRTDIYALAVLLYELLTGTTPFDKERLRTAAYDEMRRIIREEEPPRPSTRISTLGEAANTVSFNRQTDPKGLSRLVRGELDWIVMKALEKDRNRRYDTASALAADVQRYLADEPVQAGPPSAWYRFGKFARRNKGPLLAASVIFLVLAGGSVGTTVGLVQAEQAWQAEAARAAGERRAKETAEKRLTQIEKGMDLLGSLFEDLDPWAEEKEGRPLRAILGDRLDQAAAALEGETVGDPLVVARLQDRLGRTYLGLGHAAPAEALFAKAVTTRQAHLGADHRLTLASQHNQALAYQAAGKQNEAIKLFEQVRDAQVEVLGADNLDTLTTLHDLAVAYWRAGKPAEAIPLLEQVRDGRVKKLGEDHDRTLATLQDLAGAYLAADRFPEAIALAEKVRDAQVKKHGEDHPRAIDALDRLAYTYQAAYKMKQALALFEQARNAIVPKLGDYHPLTLRILHNLAHMYRVYGRTPEAIALFEQVRERQTMVLGGHHPSTLITLLELALAYRDAGQLDRALPLAEQAAAGVERLKFAHVEAWRIIDTLCDCHERLGQYDRAEVWWRKWLAVVKEKDGPESAAYARDLAGLGSNLLRQKRYAEAEPILRECLASRRDKRPEARETFHAQSLLGAALLGQQKYAETEPLLVQAYQGMIQLEKDPGQGRHDPSIKERLTDALERLVQLYDAWGMKDQADEWRRKWEEAKSPSTPPARP
jgi:eukaryotic-like serine/threonine-protein kinase